VGCPGWGGTGSMYTEVFLNGQLVGGGTQDGYCGCGTCYPLTVTSPEYANGFPGYVYGGTNQLFLEIDGVSCISDVHLKLYYSPAGRIFPDKAKGLAIEVIGKDYGYDLPGWWPEKIKGFTKYYVNDDGIVELLKPEQIQSLDCSGLSFWSYNRAYYDGKKIFAGKRWETEEGDWENRPFYWYGANMQYKANIEKIKKEELKPGDLVFFNVTYKENGKIKWCTLTECDKIIDRVAIYLGLYKGEEDVVVHAHAGPDNRDNEGKISVSTNEGLINYYKEKTDREEAIIVFFGRAMDAKGPEFKAAAHSPVDLIVIDPDGEIITKEIGESPTMEYIVYDINGDGELDDIVASPERKLGDYLIEVVPEPDTLPEDTYSLEVTANGETVVLAEDVPISDIPRTPYILRSTETEIIPIIPAFVDFDPDTLNLKSKGKWVTVYIELPIGYDVNEIDLESIIFNGQIQIEPKPIEIGDYDDNGIADLMVKFNRKDAQDILEVGEEVKITISGNLIDERPFEGSDTIRVIE
jgi:hypothetical protein